MTIPGGIRVKLSLALLVIVGSALLAAYAIIVPSLERLRGGADYREPRTIDVHVRHLREKIELEPREPELILTVRGAGYRFRDG